MNLRPQGWKKILVEYHIPKSKKFLGIKLDLRALELRNWKIPFVILEFLERRGLRD